MNLIKKFALLFLAMYLQISSHSQTPGKDSVALRTSVFHLSFVTPVGTNGMESWNTVNKISVNLIAGCSGGVDGAEFSGFGSLIRKDVKGFQGAGFANAVLGKTEGAQFAGFSNFSKSALKGAQFSGFANVVTDSATAFQGAGFANVVKGNLKGFQIAGFANVTHGDVLGTQLAGFANIATGDVKGAQVSGFVNVAGDVNGLQLGVINVAKSVSGGAPVGVFSFVKNGYRAVEISGNESFYGMISFKTGIRAFYNIISLGASIRNDKVNWGWGYGFGTLITTGERTELAIEALSFHVNEEEWHTDRLNLLNRIQSVFSWKVNDYLSVFGGPSFNVMVSKAKDENGQAYSPAIVPWTVYNRIHRNTRVQMYPGFSVGVRL